MKLQTIKFVAIIAILTAGGFSCTKDGNTDDDNMVSIKIQTFNCKVDPYIVSFALPGIIDARCYEGPPYHSYGGFPPEEWGPDDWSIHLVMEKGTDRTKLAPIITLAPGATITPKSGTVLDFTKNIEWTLKAPDGTTVKYFMSSIFVTGDTDEANMVSIKIHSINTDVVDPNIVSFALPGIVVATIYEHPPFPNYGGVPESWSPHTWLIGLGMAKGTDCTKLSPIITLAPGAAIYSKHADVQDFSQQVEYSVINYDGSTFTYHFLAYAFDD